jgi:predicted nuclease of restriction endonuclease-like (RecB) superfamily
MAKKRKQPISPAKAPGRVPGVAQGGLIEDLRRLIEEARAGVAKAVNSGMVLHYWRVGHRIRAEVLASKRAAYGEEILSTVSKELVAAYGRGYSVPNLSRMTRLAEYFPDPQVVGALSRELSWSHFVEIIPLKTDLHREFYAEMCRVERWNVRTLRDKIGGMLFERTALSRKPEELAKQELAKLREADQLSPDLVFRDPYFLDFLGLADTYSERDLEAAILREMERFILELGAGFAFVARQKRIVIDGHDFYIDLLFYRSLPAGGIGQRGEDRPVTHVNHDRRPVDSACHARPLGLSLAKIGGPHGNHKHSPSEVAALEACGARPGG